MMEDEEEGVTVDSSTAKKQEEAVAVPSSKDGSSDKNNKEAEKKKMVTIGELFSFARSRKSKLCIAGAFVFACISGASFPGTCYGLQ